MTWRQEHGFTLIEVLVAVTVTALLLTTVYGVFASASRTKEKLEADGAGYHQARVLFDRLGRELRGAYVLPTNKNTRFAGGLDEENQLFLELSTTAVTPYGGNRGGIALVRYELQPEEEAAPREEVSWELIRKEVNLFEAQRLEDPGYRLAGGIHEMVIRYYSNDEWREDWPLSLGSPPQMVEITLMVEVDGVPVPLRTTFEVPFIQ